MVRQTASGERNRRILAFLNWLTASVLVTFVVPGALILALPGGQRAAGIATLTAVPFIEYLAVSIAIGFGINPVISFLLTVLPCTGIALLLTGLLGFLGDSSPGATRFLEKVGKTIDRYPRLRKYGVASSFLFVMFLGIYIAPGISVLLGWPRERSVLLMAGGISFVTLLIGLAAVGVIRLVAG